MFASTIRLTFLSALLLLSPAVTDAFVFKAAAKLSSSLQSSAKTVKAGNYYIENVKTGKKISFSRARGSPDLGLSKSGSHMQLSLVKNNWMRIQASTSGKCFSAQWTTSGGGFNHAATLYACCKGAKNCDNGNKKDGPLRFQKQSYLLIPVKSSIVSRVTSAIKALAKRDSEPDLDYDSAVPLDQDDDEEEEEVEERSALEVVVKNEKVTRARRSSQSNRTMMKRGSQGPFYIVAVDHVTDMTTRVVTATTMKTAGSYISLKLAEMNSKDKSQQWIFHRV